MGNERKLPSEGKWVKRIDPMILTFKNNPSTAVQSMAQALKEMAGEMDDILERLDALEEARGSR